MKWYLVFVSMLFLLRCSAQEITNINPKVSIIGASAFYIHEVLEGQSLKAIADAYVSKPVKIKEANPSKEEPFEPGTKLRIPFSDASAMVMSKYDLKPKKPLQPKGKLVEPESFQPKKEEPKNIGPIEEAIALENEYEASDSIPESETAGQESVKDTSGGGQTDDLKALSELSQSLNESMGELNNLEKNVKEKPYLDKDGLPKLEVENAGLNSSQEIRVKGKPLSVFVDRMVEPMLNKTSPDGANHYLNEYFLIRINKEGVITNVRDERTQTNENTHFIEPDSLKGYYLTEDLDRIDRQFIPIGLVAELHRQSYVVKFRKNKAKFKTGEPDSEVMNLVLMYGTENKLWGKYEVSVVQAHWYVSTYRKFEYNPFGTLDQKLYWDNRLFVEDADLY